MIFVDTVSKDLNSENFAYTNIDGDVEYVQADVRENSVDLCEFGHTGLSCVYFKDIPKLILALQAAYDFKFKENT